MKDKFIPRTDQGKADFLDNLALKLPIYAALLGVTPAEVTSVVNDAAMFNYVMDDQEAFKTHKQNVSNYKNALRDGPLGTPLGALPVAPTLPAGEVWTYLGKNGTVSLPDLPNKVKKETTLVHQAIGWLAREDKIILTKQGRMTFHPFVSLL